MQMPMRGVPMRPESDRRYVVDMIKHHQMAVDMSNALLRTTRDADLRTFAENVVKAQSREIAWLQLKLRSLIAR